jgi:CCR4-NOT transcription complex subunit 2
MAHFDSQGQTPLRPPSLGPNPGLPGPFRGGPYPQYGIPSRNVNLLPGGFLPGLQPRTPSQQQQQQNMVPNSTPAFMQPQRNQSNFPFGGIGQQTPAQQPQQQQQQHQPTTPLQQHSQQQQSNGASTGLPPHLTQSATTPSLTGTAPSVSSASEVGLDPNDFPALGSSAPTNLANNGSGGAAASYASQAGTGVPIATGGAGAGGAGTANGNSNQPRDFTSDDFPALSGQSQVQTQGSSNPDHSHPPPPGLNGFQHTTDHSTQQQQHRQNLLGSIHQPGTPGMLNIGAQARNVHPGFQQQSEAEKQRVSTFDSPVIVVVGFYRARDECLFLGVTSVSRY